MDKDEQDYYEELFELVRYECLACKNVMWATEYAEISGLNDPSWCPFCGISFVIEGFEGEDA